MSEENEENEPQQPSDDWPTWAKSRTSMMIAGVVTVLLIAGGVFYLVSKQVARNQPVKKQSQGLALTAPAQWTRVRPTPRGSVVAYTAPTAETDATGKLTPYLAVEDYTLSAAGKNATFQKLESDFESQLAHDYSGYTQLASSNATIEKMPALLLTFSYEQNKAAVTSQSLFMVKNGKLYDVHGDSLTSTWPNHSQDVQHALLSFRP